MQHEIAAEGGVAARQARPLSQVFHSLRADAQRRNHRQHRPRSRAGYACDRKETDALLVVDAITGLGTTHFDVDGWGIDVIIGGSQKAVMIPPGLAYCDGRSAA